MEKVVRITMDINWLSHCQIIRSKKLKCKKVCLLISLRYDRKRIIFKKFESVARGQGRGASWRHFVGLSEGGLWLRLWWVFGHSDREVLLVWQFFSWRVTSLLGIPKTGQGWNRHTWLRWKQLSAASKERVEKSGPWEKAGHKGQCGRGRRVRGHAKCN
jgi:hypothetical protein